MVREGMLERWPFKRRGGDLPYWIEPTFTIVAFSCFILYSLWAVMQPTGLYANYVSPYNSPPIGNWLHVPFPPALLVAWIPLFFRGTCYYYRREYYRGFGAHPFGCATPERLGRRYGGERRFPWVFNNSHRYWWYLAVLVLIYIWVDTLHAFVFPEGWGIGVGSLLMLANAILLTLYTFSCHAFRHLAGGRRDCYACPKAPQTPPARYRIWRRISEMNRYHGHYAWASMASVVLVDLYIRLLIAGVIPDLRLVK